MRQEFLHIGTSGWHYAHWIGVFYPPGIRKSGWLRHYAAHLNTVELNNSFYRLPARETFASWREQTPDGFVFAVKASRFITHVKKLRGSPQTVPRFLERASALEEKLGIVLYQLPPGWKFDAGRLEEFLRALPAGHRSVFEFRNPSWFNDWAYELLKTFGVAFCIHDAEGTATPMIITGDRVYVRLHGATGMYRGSYTEEQLQAWADRIGDWENRAREVFFYFNNDWEGFAIRNAIRLREICLERRSVVSG